MKGRREVAGALLDEAEHSMAKDGWEGPRARVLEVACDGWKSVLHEQSEGMKRPHGPQQSAAWSATFAATWEATSTPQQARLRAQRPPERAAFLGSSPHRTAGGCGNTYEGRGAGAN